MTDLVDSGHVGMHIYLFFSILNLWTYMWAEFELLNFDTYLTSALWRDLRFMCKLWKALSHFESLNLESEANFLGGNFCLVS